MLRGATAGPSGRSVLGPADTGTCQTEALDTWQEIFGTMLNMKPRTIELLAPGIERDGGPELQALA